MEDFKEINLDEQDSCKFGGSDYSHGSEICSGGKMIRCHDGEWEDIGESCKENEKEVYLNNNRTATFTDKSKAENDKSNVIPCVKYEFNPRDPNRTIYLVNDCNECKKIRIHWYAGSRDAWGTYQVNANSIILIRQVYGNSRMVSESDC
jgi:hypothetical protein